MGDTSISNATAVIGTDVDPSNAAGLDAMYGDGASARVANASILVVGAGGVGCEVVKNLAFAGFRSVTLIDLDTIDVSNLNRQFLFRRHHVSEPKAVTAASAIRSMVPHMQIEGIVANIKDPRFDVTYFKKFNLVCNALDNLDARRHVNRMCLAASVPLIESGSTGYNGQVYVLSPDVECYDCTEKPQQKSYAVCTIRSTPEKPVHCVVWAKSLWDLIFGPDDDGNLLSDLDGGGEGHAEIGDNAVDKARKKPVRRVRYSHPEPAHEFAERVCTRVFVDDIAEQAAMKELWATRDPPVPFDVTAACGGSKVNLSKLNLLEQRAWEKEESARVIRAVLVHMVEKRSEEIGTVGFDKDDSDALAFVIAAANLRAQAYGVERSTPFQVKGIAGNIVHAIATTNAMVGGLVVVEALKVTTKSGDVSSSFNTFVSRQPIGSRVRVAICPERLRKPKPNCFVCSKGQLLLTLDTERTTLKMLVENVLVSKISALEPSVHVSTGDFHNTLYECGQGLEDDEVEMYADNLKKSLSDLRVTTGSQLQIEDFKQSLTCVIHVVHEEGCEADKPAAAQFILKGAPSVTDTPNGMPAPKTGVHESKLSNEPVDVDDDELEIVPLTSNEPVQEVIVAGKTDIIAEDEAVKKIGLVMGDKPLDAVCATAVDSTSVTPDEGSTENHEYKEATTIDKPAFGGIENSRENPIPDARPSVDVCETTLMNVEEKTKAVEEEDTGENVILKKRKMSTNAREDSQSMKRAREDHNPAMA